MRSEESDGICQNTHMIDFNVEYFPTGIGKEKNYRFFKRLDLKVY